MPTGSVLRYFSTVELGTADGKQYTLQTSRLTRIALAVIGIPHLGFRARARIIFHFLSDTPKNIRILDAGSGYGIYALTLANKGYSVDAIDLEEERTIALDERKKERSELDARIRTFTGSITALPFADASYDTIICSDVIEHIEDDTRAVSELSRVLAPGGTMIITVPYHSENNKRIYRMFGHERPGYSAEEMRSLTEPYGLAIEAVDAFEYRFGDALFKAFNSIHYPPLMALLFYPFYLPYLIDMKLKIGEPNGICFKLRKRS